jgi:hypothetical protein
VRGAADRTRNRLTPQAVFWDTANRRETEARTTNGVPGEPIPGFTLADCEEVGGNFIDQTVHWKGNADVSALAGRPVRIHFQMKRAKLYAFQFTRE